MAQILFKPIQNHDNKKQARIYPTKLKHIVVRRQSRIISGLNKCKILTGTNASNGSRTQGYISPLCSLALAGMYLCSFSFDHPGRLGGRSSAVDKWLLSSQARCRCAYLEHCMGTPKHCLIRTAILTRTQGVGLHENRVRNLYTSILK